MSKYPTRKKPKSRIRKLLPLILVISILITYQQVMQPSNTDVELVMVYGSEKRAWIEEVAPDFERWWAQNHPDTRLKLSFTPLGSRESMLQIVRKTVTPTIWSPASSLWVPLINKIWNDQHPQDEEQNFVLVENAPALVLSPTIIGTWTSYKETHNITGFETLNQLAKQPDSDLKFAHTDPQLSNSGFLAVVLEIAAALDKPPSEITLKDLVDKSMLNWMTELESRAQFYGTSTGFLATDAVSDGPQTLNAFVIYENLIIDSNLYSVDKERWQDQLEAVYPEKGTIMNDHPFAILQGDWVTEKQKEAAQEFMSFLLRKDIQEKAMATGFRPANPEVELDPKIFNSANGVLVDIGIPIHDPRDFDADVLWRIPDVWLITRRN